MMPTLLIAPMRAAGVMVHLFDSRVVHYKRGERLVGRGGTF